MKTMQQLYETKNLSFEDLSIVKKHLRQKIDKQQEQIFVSSKRLVPFTKNSTTLSLKNKALSPLSFITTPLRKGKAISLVEGIVMGYKVVRSIKKLMRK